MNRSKLISVFGVLLCLVIASPAEACETTFMEIGGQLDLRSPISVPPLGPAQLGLVDGYTLTGLRSTASFSVQTRIFDVKGTSHTFYVLFYHTDDRSWTAFVMYDASEVGGTAGQPVIAGFKVLNFTNNGTRVIKPTVTSPDLYVDVTWILEDISQTVNINFDPVIESAAASEITSLQQDGRAGACIQRGNLDFDGDGVDDMVVWRPSTGMWYVRLSTTSFAEAISKQWGLPGDYPMAGDYTGDGKADLVVWRPTDGNWYVCRSDRNFDCTRPTIQQFGLPGDRPIKGDFDGDGVLDYAVWRPSTGMFYYKSSRTREVIVQQWGLPGDIPMTTGTSR